MRRFIFQQRSEQCPSPEQPRPPVQVCHVVDANCADAPARLNIDSCGNYLLRQTARFPTSNGLTMIVLGIILLLIGYFAGISILYTIGGILLVIGVILWILGAVGRPVGGRKVWF
ncbi:hypothetical protein VST63_11655 [Mycolicibacterium sp. 050232]|nr:hypothetical protein [Mycolicibacterium sp. 050232]MED5813016.1 hypothetical protein [Mycolicibacterium sp. 050232]